MCSGVDMRKIVDAIYEKRKTAQDVGCVLNLLELLLSLKLRRLCNKEGKESFPKKSAEVLHALGKTYRQRSPERLALIKSAILFNAALVRNPEIKQMVQRDLDELYQHVLKRSGSNFSQISLSDKAISLRAKIKEFRNYVEIQLKPRNQPVEKKHNRNKYGSKATEVVENLQQNIYDWYCSLMQDLMHYSVAVVGPAPCRYALVGMGSLARKEITPYSDFEHIILLEEEVQKRKDYNSILEYFRWASTIFNIVLVNLGETIVPCAALPHLNSSCDKDYDWFYDDFTKRGITIDGMFPHASKFPLGRSGTSAKPWKTELIKPVTRMLKYLSGNESLKNGYHLSDILTCTCFVSGDESIYEKFQTGVKKVMGKPSSKLFLQEQLKIDLQAFSAINNLDSVLKKEKWNVKRVVYRTTTLFIAALGKHHGLCEGSSFQTIRELANHRVISETLACELLEAVAIACHVRLSTYSESNRQEDWIESFQSSQASIQFKNLPSGTPLRYFHTTLKLQRKTCEIIGLYNFSFVQWSPQLDKVLSLFWLHEYEEVLWEADRILEDSKTTANTLNILNQILLEIGFSYWTRGNHYRSVLFFQRAYSCIDLNLFATKEDKEYCLEYLRPCCLASERFKEGLMWYRDLLESAVHLEERGKLSNDVKHEVLYLANALAGRSEHHEAVSLLKLAFSFEEFLSKERKSSSYSSKRLLYLAQVFLGQNLLGNKKYAQAVWYLRKVVEALEELVSCKQGNDYRKHKADNDNESGDCGSYVDEIDVKLILANACSELGASLLKLEDLDNARYYLELSELFFKGFETMDLAKERLHLYSNLGQCLYQQNNYTEALQYFRQAANMACDTENNSSQTSSSSSEISYKMKKCLICRESKSEPGELSKLAMEVSSKDVADYLFEQRAYEEAGEFYQRAISVRKTTEEREGNGHVLSKYYYSQGICLLKTSNYAEALTCFVQVQKLRKKSETGASNAEYISTSLLLAKCFSSLKKYDNALKLFEKVISWQAKVSQTKKTNETMAFLLKEAGFCCFQLKNYDVAMVHCKKSKKILDELEDSDSVSNLIDATEMIGDCFFKLNNCVEASKYYKEALFTAEERNELCDKKSILRSLCRKLGICHFKIELFEFAKRWFELAVELLP